jgi:8-oxo-dGTP pyrophosphatase MutT (NUDIX family)
LSNIIDNSTTSWKETEWDFPKGRKNFQEKDLECAKREFQEETGYSFSDIYIINNLLPFEELFIGSNHKSYKNKYFLAFMNKNLKEPANYQKSEVSKIEWKSYEDCLNHIRPYNIEKIKLLKNIQEIIQTYEFHYIRESTDQIMR